MSERITPTRWQFNVSDVKHKHVIEFKHKLFLKQNIRLLLADLPVLCFSEIYLRSMYRINIEEKREHFELTQNRTCEEHRRSNDYKLPRVREIGWGRALD
jgi:hypothetical protein